MRPRADAVIAGTLDDGPAFADEARRRWPELPVILAAGDSISAARATGLG